jgi:AbiV family abortive infection protein
MKKDLDRVLTNDDCYNLIEPSLEQAKNLYNASHVLYQKKYYSIAYSLFILSLEEVGKALISSFGLYGILKIRTGDLYSHSCKQKMSMLTILGSIIFITKILPNILKEKNIPLEHLRKTSKFLASTENSLNEFFGVLFSAEELKEQGLYVSYDDENQLAIPTDNFERESFPSFYRRKDFISLWSKEILGGINEKKQIMEAAKMIIPHKLPMTVREFLSYAIIEPMK